MNTVAACKAKESSTIREFFGICEFPAVSEEVMNTKNKARVELASVLLNRWTVYSIGSESLYVKHVPSKQPNVLYQVIVGGNDEWNGVYEFSLQNRTKVNVSTQKRNGDTILSIESRGNYDIAFFNIEGKEQSVTRMDYETDDAFKKALIQLNLLDENDIETYFKPNATAKKYLDKILPKIDLR